MKLLITGALAVMLTGAGPAAAPPLSRAAQDGVDHGFKTCAPAVDMLVKFIHPDDEAYAVVSTWSRTHPDEGTFNVVTVQHDDEGDLISSVSGLRNVRGSCDVNFTQSAALVDTSCAELRKLAFKDWKAGDRLIQTDVFEDKTAPGMSAFLTPLKNGGCLVTRQYLLTGYSQE
jgi:hypothetical protein